LIFAAQLGRRHLRQAGSFLGFRDQRLIVADQKDYLLKGLRMDSKIMQKAAMGAAISIIVCSALAVERAANSYSYLGHSKTRASRLVTTLVSPGPGMVSADKSNDKTPDESGRYGLSGSIFDGFLMTRNNLAAGPTPTPTALSGPCTWFVSTSGSFGGKGSIGSPWSLKRVFGGDPDFEGVAPPSAIKPGDTVCLRGGTYTGFFQTILSGTPRQPITIQPYPGEAAIIDSASEACGSFNCNDTVIITGKGNLIIAGLEVTDSYAANRTDARPGGISVLARNVKVINNVIHDVGGGIGSSDAAYDCEFYGNVIYNSGWDDTHNGLGQGGTGHGMYIQNQYGFKKIYDNIITGSFGYGLHAYVSGAHLINLDVQGSISFDNGYWTRGTPGPYCSTTGYGCEGGGSVNFFFGAGHIPVTNLTLLNNYGFHREHRAGTNLQLGYGGGENLSVNAQSNTFVGGDNLLFKFENVTLAGNFFASSVQSLNWIKPDTYDQSKQNIDGNKYYIYRNPPADCNAAQFDGTFGFQGVAQWKANGFDAHSTFFPCGTRPSGVRVDVRKNAYDPNRAHVIINNYSKSATVIVDLSLVLKAGDSFEIRNAQDYFGPLVASGIYQEPIVLRMDNLTVARPVGWSGRIIPSSGPEFGAFVLIKR
jgi:hypothetical protein